MDNSQGFQRRETFFEIFEECVSLEVLYKTKKKELYESEEFLEK